MKFKKDDIIILTGKKSTGSSWNQLINFGADFNPIGTEARIERIDLERKRYVIRILSNTQYFKYPEIYVKDPDIKLPDKLPEELFEI
jgi:hypothetical protein